MKNNVFNILKKELREMFRDKKSLSMMLVIPIFIPLLVIGMSALFESQMNMPVTDYNTIGFNYELDTVEQSIIEELEINPVYDTEENLKEKFDNGEIDLYVTRNNTVYTINGDDSDTTTYASTLVESYFNAYKDYLQTDYLVNHNVDPSMVMNIITLEENIIAEDNFFASYVTNYAFFFIIMAITVSATYPATDATAGEKERGTLETLLTFPIKSKDIIIGKFLSVTLSSIITGVLSLILAIISLKIANNMFSIYEGMDLMLPASSLIFALIVILAYSLLISGLCIAIASKSKTFKEAQSALTPLTFISFFPGMIAFMIGITTTNVYACIPFLNYTLIFTDITSGNINFVHILLMLVSTIIIIAVVLKIIIKQYKSERVLFG
ncbi:MAG TPA: ABC transporter permease [Candidatus Caccenecus avistercoris]|nr:ABC transporter permease [Candidatus Caccenecus avistercoris]